MSEKFLLKNIKEQVSGYPPKSFDFKGEHYTVLGPSLKTDLLCNESEYIRSGQYIVTDEHCNIYQALFVVSAIGTIYLDALRTNQMPDKKKVKKEDDNQ